MVDLDTDQQPKETGTPVEATPVHSMLKYIST